MRFSLLTKFFAAYLAPVLSLIALMQIYGWTLVHRSIDDEIGNRLTGLAAVAASSQRADLLLTLTPGDDDNRTHRNVVARLESMREAGKASRFYIFDLEGRLLASTGEAQPIGTALPEIGSDRSEIDWAIAHRQPISSRIAFRGSEGRLFKSGYAPIIDEEDRVVALVGVDASADFFDVVNRMEWTVRALSFAIGLLGLGLFYFTGSRWLLRPIRKLARAAARIGKGDLLTTVSSGRRDELGLLATGMERMRAKLLERERELQLMLAGIAHEVRNPLGGISLFTGLLEEELEGEPDKLAHIRKIRRELNHLERLVDDFLGYARDQRIERAPIDAGELFSDLAELLRPELTEKKQALHIDVRGAGGAPSVEIAADETALRRALLNLLRNASQASPEGGNLWLRAAGGSAGVVLSVENDGPCIPQEVREQMFTPFFTTREKGIGLGLPLVQRIAEAHGGALRLVPTERGAHFEMSLPLAPAREGGNRRVA